MKVRIFLVKIEPEGHIQACREEGCLFEPSFIDDCAQYIRHQSERIILQIDICLFLWIEKVLFHLLPIRRSSLTPGLAWV